jgi:plasmid stabilization system protein ParE
MTRPLVLLPEAEEEVRAAVRWYESRPAGLGVEFIGVVQHALSRIADAPDQFAAWAADPRYRRAVVSRFPFVVVFEDRSEAVEIVVSPGGGR